jgi:hypothetical protein
MDDEEDIVRLQALYRSVAHETPSAAMDKAILGAAARKVSRDRATPFLALAAGLLVAVLIVRDLGPPTPGAAPQETRNFLLALHTPASGSGPEVATGTGQEAAQ